MSEARHGSTPRWTTFDVAHDGKRVIAFVPEDPADRRITVHATFLFNFFDEIRRRIP